MLADEMAIHGLVGAIFVGTLLSIGLLINLAPKIGLLAAPGEHRQHSVSTPTVGGIAIFLGLSLGLILGDQNSVLLLPSLFLICLVGAFDDRYTLPSWSRFVVQAIAAYLMVYFTDVVLEDLGYLVSSSDRVLLNKFWSISLTIFACIGVINALNMSDGLDGLAGCIVLLVLMALLLIGHPEQKLILIALGAVTGFLFWNLRIGRAQARVFMGDAGSMMLGLLLAYLLIRHSQIDNGIAPVTALWFLALPLIDAVSVLIVRPLRGRSPFSADRIHYHHQLLDKGFSVNKVLLTSLVLQLVLLCFGVFFRQANIAEHIQLMLFLTVFSVYLIRLYFFSASLSNSES